MLLFAQPSFFSNTYDVVSVDRKITPAFRLGSEVRDTLVVSRDGKKFKISLSMQHTAAGPVKLFAAGDQIIISKDSLKDGETISREKVKLAK